MELTNTKTYSEFKQELDSELGKTAEGFVRIGYLLKIARDTDILKESGYANVNDFAAAEYGLDKSQVSRFININDRFSEGGYSEHLTEQYKAYGYAKLAMMLTLPEAVVEEITPSYSKSEIQAIKEEYDTEVAIPPIETYLEGEKEEQQALPTMLDKVINQLLHDEPKLFSLLHHQIKNGGEAENIKDVIAPSGDSFHSVRIQGVGRKFLTTKDGIEDITITDARNGEKEIYKWQDIITICHALINPDVSDKDNWEQIYEEQFPTEEKKPEVAPVQLKTEQPKEDKKPAPKKISKVTKAKTPKKPEKLKADKGCDTSQKEPENFENVTINDTKTPVETNTEVIETEKEDKKAAVESSETRINTSYGRISEGQKKVYIEEIEFKADEIKRFANDGAYGIARDITEQIREILIKLLNAPEEDE